MYIGTGGRGLYYGEEVEATGISAGSISRASRNTAAVAAIAAGLVRIRMSAEGRSDIRIYTVSGKLLYAKSVQGHIGESIKARGLGTGLFLIRIDTGDLTRVETIAVR